MSMKDKFENIFEKYPKKITMGGEYRRSTMVARIFALAFAGSMVFNFMLLAVIFTLSTKSQPELVFVSSDDDIAIETDMVKASPENMQIYAMNMVKKWVINRFRIIPVNDVVLDQLEFLYANTDPDYFTSKITAPDNQKLVDSFVAQNLTRKVKITSILPASKGSYAVKFTTSDYNDKGALLQEINMEASVEFEFESGYLVADRKQVTHSNYQTRNLFGFKITNLSLGVVK